MVTTDITKPPTARVRPPVICQVRSLKWPELHANGIPSIPDTKYGGAVRRSAVVRFLKPRLVVMISGDAAIERWEYYLAIIVGKKLLNVTAEMCRFCIRQKSQVRGSAHACLRPSQVVPRSLTPTVSRRIRATARSRSCWVSQRVTEGPHRSQ